MRLSRATIIRRAVVLTAILATAGVFYRYGIAPIERHEATIGREVGEVRGQLAAARLAIQDIKQQEQGTSRGRQMLNSLHQNMPTEPAVSWFPVMLRTHLQNFGIAEATVRMNGSRLEPGVLGYERTFWRLTLPRQEGVRSINSILLAVAEIEQIDGAVRVLDLSLQSDPDPPHSPLGGVNIAALVRK